MDEQAKVLRAGRSRWLSIPGSGSQLLNMTLPSQRAVLVHADKLSITLTIDDGVESEQRKVTERASGKEVDESCDAGRREEERRPTDEGKAEDAGKSCFWGGTAALFTVSEWRERSVTRRSTVYLNAIDAAAGR